MKFIQLVKSEIKKILPAQHGWSGNYADWNTALQQGTGYDAENILQKVKEATLKVKNGEAVYERDSVLFDTIEYSWPLLSALLLAAAKHEGHLKVLDFGGSLGSTYFQNRLYLNELKSVEWNVVEQASFVDCGRQFIQDNQLRFFYTIDEYLLHNPLPQILVLSSTLPYLEQPYQLLGSLLNYRIPYVLIDLTYFNYEERDRIAIQKVPAAIYSASYPCWFLSYPKVKNMLTASYDILSEHQNEFTISLDHHKIPYRGLLAKLK